MLQHPTVPTEGGWSMGTAYHNPQIKNGQFSLAVPPADCKATPDPQFCTVRKTLQNNDNNPLHWETRLEVDIFQKTDKTDIPSVSLDS